MPQLSHHVPERILWMPKANVLWESHVLQTLPFQRPFEQTVPQRQKHVLPQFVIDRLHLHNLLIRLLRTPPKNAPVVPMKFLVQLFYLLQLIHWRRVLINFIFTCLFDRFLDPWLRSSCPVVLLVLSWCAGFFGVRLFLIFILFLIDWFLFSVDFMSLIEKWCLIELWFRLFYFTNCLCLSCLFLNLSLIDLRLIILFDLPNDLRLLIALKLLIHFLPSAFCNFLDIDVDNIVKPFSQFSPHFCIVVYVLLKKIFLAVANFPQNFRRTRVKEIAFDHHWFNEVFVEFHQVVNFKVLEGFVFQLTVSSVSDMGVIGFNKVMGGLLDGKNFVAVFAKVFAWKRDKISFGVGLHSESGAGGNLKGDFHVIVFEVFLGESGAERKWRGEMKEFAEEVKFICGLHD